MKNKKIKYLYWLMGVLAIAAIIGTIFALINFKPEFFDIFGLITFTFLTISGSWMLLTKKETPNIVAWAFLAIGVLGLIVDGFIVIKVFGLGLG